jgi:hypothetical protein
VKSIATPTRNAIRTYPVNLPPGIKAHDVVKAKIASGHPIADLPEERRKIEIAVTPHSALVYL